MTPPDDDDAPAQFASPACLMHEVDPAYMGNAGPALPTPETLARLGGVLLRDIPDAVMHMVATHSKEGDLLDCQAFGLDTNTLL